MAGAMISILNMSIAGGIAIVCVLLLRLILRRAPKWIPLLLWGIVALRLVVPVFIQAPVGMMPERAMLTESAAISGTERETASKPAASAAPASSAAPAGRPNAGMTDPVPGQTEKTPSTFAPSVTAPEKPAPAAAVTTTEKPADWRTVLACVWLGGAALMLAYSAISYAALKLRLRTAVRSERGVFESEHVKTPFLLGLSRPRVYVPFGLDDASLVYVLRHENAHMRNLDHLWKPIGYAVLAVHWFNPLCWLAYALFCRDLELACDERVIRGLNESERAGYSRALLELSIPKRSLSACPMAFGEGDAKKRIKSVLSFKKPALWLILVSLALCAALAVFAACSAGGGDRSYDPVLSYPMGGAEFRIDLETLCLGSAAPYIERDGEKLFEFEDMSRSHAGMTTYAHAVIDGKDCVLQYSPYLGGGTFSIGYRLYTIDEDGVRLAEEDGFMIGLIGAGESADVNNCAAVIGRANELWKSSKLIVTTDRFCLMKGKLTCSENGAAYDPGDAWFLVFTQRDISPLQDKFLIRAERKPLTYEEDLSAVDSFFDGAAGYRSDMDVRGKLACIASYAAENAGPDALLNTATENGWVYVNRQYEFACGRELWDGFIARVNDKQPAEVTVLCDMKMESAGSSGPEREAIERTSVHTISFDGRKYSVSTRELAEGSDRVESFRCLDRFTVTERGWMGEEGRYYLYALMDAPLDRSTRYVTDPYAAGWYTLFMINAHPETNALLSEMERDELIDTLTGLGLVIPTEPDIEKVDINTMVKRIEELYVFTGKTSDGSAQQMPWDISGDPQAAEYLVMALLEYDVRYFTLVYYGLETPANGLVALSHMGYDFCVNRLYVLGADMPEDGDDPRFDAAQLEYDIEAPNPYAKIPGGEEKAERFEKIRTAVRRYNEPGRTFIYGTRAHYDDYLASVGAFLDEGRFDPYYFVSSTYPYVSFDMRDGELCAYDVSRRYAETFPPDNGSETYFEFDHELARFPGELWERAPELLSRQSGEPSVGPTPWGFICEDGILMMTEDRNDRQANVIFHKYSDGEWREFGNSNKDYAYTPSGFCTVSDRVGFICYANRWEYRQSEGEHEYDWVNVWASYDGGESWKNLELTLPERFAGSSTMPAACSPVFKGDHGAIPVVSSFFDASAETGETYLSYFETFDGGVTWSYAGSERIR